MPVEGHGSVVTTLNQPPKHAQTLRREPRNPKVTKPCIFFFAFHYLLLTFITTYPIFLVIGGHDPVCVCFSKIAGETFETVKMYEVYVRMIHLG